MKVKRDLLDKKCLFCEEQSNVRIGNFNYCNECSLIVKEKVIKNKTFYRNRKNKLFSTSARGEARKLRISFYGRKKKYVRKDMRRVDEREERMFKVIMDHVSDGVCYVPKSAFVERFGKFSLDLEEKLRRSGLIKWESYFPFGLPE